MALSLAMGAALVAGAMTTGIVAHADGAQLVLSPSSSTITAGGHQAYTAQFIDASGFSGGDVTPYTVFTLDDATGSCTLNSCTETKVKAGGHTVTGTYTFGGVQGKATLTVTAGPAVALTLTPANGTISAGGSATYKAEGTDAYGNDAGDVTSATTFTISPDGSCTGATCTATKAGAHTVTGTDGVATGATGLTVNGASVNHLTLTPGSSTITAGGIQPYSAEAFDAYGNDLGNVTASTTFTISPDGSCTGATCTATKAGTHTVTGTDGGATGTATLAVDAGPAASLTLSPAGASIPVGGQKTYKAEAFDAHGNDLGDVTGSTVFIITPDGLCTGATCAASVAGDHTVTGVDGAATGNTKLHVLVLDHLVLSPAGATIAAGGQQAYTAEGFDSHGTDLGDVTGGTTFTLDDVTGSCTRATCTETKAGPHTVTGTDAGATGSTGLTVTSGPLVGLTISPATKPITAGQTQAYTATGVDAYGNITDVTAATTFAIGPDGSCSGSTCGATTSGTHTVTGTDGGTSATAVLTVNAAGLDHLVLSPASATISAGGSQLYTAEGFDKYNNDLGSDTLNTTFSIGPDGLCSSATCTATKAGVHTVTGADKTTSTATGTAMLTVNPGPLAKIRLTPDPASIPLGGRQTYKSEGYDTYDNDLGNVTSSTAFAITPDGLCSGSTCTPAATGDHVVTGTDGAFSYRATLHVLPVDHVTLSPSSASIAAGGHQAYTAEAFDASNHDLGDVTPGTTFSIVPDGSCSGATCTATKTGAHTVTGTDNGTSATAALTVTAASATSLTIAPANGTITAGGSLVYSAEGFDAYGNDAGNVTSATTFSIAPDGSCAAATCTANKAGAHTVTGTDGAATGSTGLTVNAARLDHLVLSPASASMTAGGHQAYTAEGFDAFGNDLGNKTLATTFTLDDVSGSCTAASCTETKAGVHTVTGTDGTATGRASLTVTAGPLAHLTLSPATVSVPVGGHQTYAAEGFDPYGNDMGDVTSATTFTVVPPGSCSGSTCTVTSAGAHTVTGTDGSATGTATLTGTPVVDHLVLSPSGATIAAGGHQAYTAEAFDASNNDLGDVTSGTTFTISPNGSCTGATCTTTSAGAHTVKGTDGSATGSTGLTVTAAAVTTLTLSPAGATITAGGSQAYTAEGFDTYGNDGGNVTSATTFSIAPDGSCSAATCSASKAGAHTVTGTDGGATGSTGLTVNAGPLDHLVLSPASASMAAGGHQAYTAEGFDAHGNDLGNVTAATTFTLDDGTGSCTLASCTETKAGAHTVTGTDSQKTGTATLTVTPGPAASLTLSPVHVFRIPGAHQAYTAEGFDVYGNDTGDVTASSTFAITPNGSCTGATCTATALGDHTVTGTDTAATGSATLTIATLDHLQLHPATASIAAGGHQAYTAEGFDASGDDLGDMTASTSFAITPNGSCSGATCTATTAGAHTVTGTDGAATGTAALTVNAGPLDHLTLSPAGASIAAGGSQVYTAEGFDHFGNDLGDKTSATTFTIGPDGSCTAASCTATAAGAHTVTGTDGAATGTTVLTVNAGPLDHLTLSPASASITSGGSQAYTAEGFDAYGNDLGDKTSATTFTIAPDGSCTAASCTATVPGAHTVTGTDAGKTGTAGLNVNAGPLDHLVISPASARIPSGSHQAYTAEGFDAHGNDLGDKTSATTFTIGPDGSCSGAVCTASATGSHTVTGTDGGKTGTATLTVTAVADTITVTPHSHALRADGASHTSVAALVTDSGGHPVAGITVSFSSVPDGSNAHPGGPVTLGPTSATTDGTGTATVTATSSKRAGYVIIVASDGSGSGTAQEHLTGARFVTTSLAQSQIPADGSSGTTATATVVDGDGNRVPGDTVNFANDGKSTSPTVAQPSAVTDANGNASTQVTSSTYGGPQTITATDASSDVPGAQFSAPLTLTQTATNASFIHAAYQTMLGHDADPSGFSYWLGRLDSGTPRSVLALSLATTTEYRTNVIGGNVASGVPDFYELYLHRAADPGGIAYWVDRMAGIGGPPLSFEQVRLQFVGSWEFFNVTNGGDPSTIIEALYQDLLDRSSDPAGKSYWLTHFDVNTIANQFLFSVEGRQVLVESYYSSILHRGFDQAGLDYWTQRLLNAASDEDIIADFLSSDEYFLSH